MRPSRVANSYRRLKLSGGVRGKTFCGSRPPGASPHVAGGPAPDSARTRSGSPPPPPWSDLQLCSIAPSSTGSAGSCAAAAVAASSATTAAALGQSHPGRNLHLDELWPLCCERVRERLVQRVAAVHPLRLDAVALCD